MKRTLIAMVAGLALGAPATAAADFHGACTPAGTADVALAHADGQFSYRGFVECGGATSIEITALTLTGGSGFSAAAPPASCAPCDLAETSDTVPAPPPGAYRVRMTFTVRVGTQTFAGRARERAYEWDGQALGPGSGPPPPSPPALGLCSTSGPRSASVAFAAELAAPPILRWSGAITCHGVDEMQISELTLQRRSALGEGRIHRADVGGARCAGCSTLSAQGTAATEGPGTYRVTMRYALRRGTEVRSATVQRDVNSLGAGPALP